MLLTPDTTTLATKPLRTPTPAADSEPARSLLPQWAAVPMRWASALAGRNSSSVRPDASADKGTAESGRLDSKARDSLAAAERTAGHDSFDPALLERMRASLHRLLKQHAAARKAFVHLDVFAQALDKRGSAAWKQAPDDLLMHALQQLETLAGGWQDPGLAGLRAQMSRTLGERAKIRRKPAFAPADNNQAVLVSEASASDFMRAQRDTLG